MTEYAPGGSNLFIRTPSKSLKKGDVVETHAHNFDHVTYVPKGSFRIEKLNGQKGQVLVTVEKHAGFDNWVLIKAGVWHRLTALEDDSIYHCIYASRNEDGSVADHYTGWGPGVI